MISQKKKGIQTDHIAKSKKESKLFRVELAMKLVTYNIVFAEVASLFLNTRMQIHR